MAGGGAPDGSPVPDLIVVLDSYPGQVPLRRVEEWQSAAPIAPVWHVLGSWASGVGRVGPVIPGAVRVAWHHAQGRLQHDLERLKRGLPFTWGQPAIREDEARWSALAQAETGEPQVLRGPNGQGIRVLIVSHDRETLDFLAQTVRGWGGMPHCRQGSTLENAPQLDIVLWDYGTDQLSEAAEAIRRFSVGPIVLIAGFPRGSEMTACRRAGVAAVVAKPYVLEELRSALKEAVASLAQSRSVQALAPSDDA